MFVRLALESDADAIVEMGRVNCEQTCAPDTYSEARARQLIVQYLETGNPTFFVVEEQRRAIGFLMARASLFDHRDGFFTTQSVLFVQPEKRGTRAAVLLMKHFVAWSQDIGAAAIIGGNDNGFQSDRTAKFLEHFGFERVGYNLCKRL